MDRSTIDPFWNRVEKVIDAGVLVCMKCKFCGHPFAKDTAITRIKWHLSGEKGHGVAICGQVPKDVQEEAFLVTRGGKKRQKTKASSSNGNVISSCPQKENNEVHNLAGDAGRIDMAVQGTEQGMGEGRTSSRAEAGNDMENMNGEMMHIDTSIAAEELIIDAHETRAEASQATDLVEKHQGVGVELLPRTQEFIDGENVTNEGDSVPGWLMLDAPENRQSIEINEEYRVPGRFIVDAPESGQRIVQMVYGVDNWAGHEGRMQPELQGMEQVPKDVQEAAFISMRDDNKRQKTIAISSNVNDNNISSCPQQENNEVDNLAGDALPTTKLAGVAQPDLVGHALGSTWGDILNFFMEDDIENGTGVVAQPGAGAGSSGGLTSNRNEKGDALPTTKLVGQAFEDNKGTIWSWLMNDEVLSIGIYGMGGVGKTTLVTHIYNQLLQKRDTFCHVYWITVSQDFSINRLQNSIARCVGLDLSNEEEELHRAVKLSNALMNREKWVLILDDLWNSFELHKVGIPFQVKGCKVILTTRLEKVCKQMDSQKRIKVKPLSKVEAWTLFMEKLGPDISLSRQLKNIAQSITEECAGLPLGIITMAGAMKGVDDICEWKNALEDLRQSRSRQDDMEEEVFRILRFSYMHLKDSAQQQCFLYCALFPEDFKIPRDDLIAYLIDEGVIKGLDSRDEEFNKGHSMLNRLEDVCLLERVKMDGDVRCVKMHDLIRDMAIQIQQLNFEVMVKAGARLKLLPDAEKWTENLLRVSLMRNQIEVIPSSYSPSCHNLSTLLLCSNQSLRFIENNFFKEMDGLKVLDLSHTSIEILPDSVFDLVSLISLLLSHCRNLRHVPSLKNLKRLKRLDLSYTALEKLPQGMECLSNLRYLRLNDCGEKEFPIGILPQLSHLQVLIIEEPMDEEHTAITVKGKEVACLRKLEILECHFEGHSDFVEYFKSPDQTQSLSRYNFFVGVLDEDSELWREYRMESWFRSKRVWLGNFSIRRDLDISFFPSDIQELIIFEWNDARSLCDVFSLAKAKELEIFTIAHCSGMESLVPSSWFCAAPPPSPSSVIFRSLTEFECFECRSMKKLFPPFLLPNLANLRVISVEHCGKMEEIIAGRDEGGVTGEEISLPKLKSLKLLNLPDLKSICSAKLRCDSLEEIEVWRCQKLKRMPICPPLLDNGQPSKRIANLRKISVGDCRKMEEIVAGRDEGGVTGEEISLPKLKHLEVVELPELKSICSAKLRCDSLEKIRVWCCQKLKRMPICLPLLDNGQPSKRIANLREIVVKGCEKMEEIIAGGDEGGVTGEEISLPELKSLTLSNLPELKSICSAKLRCDSLGIICVQECPKLKRMPICLPLLDNGRPSPPPSLSIIWIGSKEWWESVVEWEHPNAKDVLRPLVRFWHP